MTGFPKEGIFILLSFHSVRYKGTMFLNAIYLWMFFPTNFSMDKKCWICHERLCFIQEPLDVCYDICHITRQWWRSNILRNAHWSCRSFCLTSVFRFNHIEDDSDSCKAISTKDNFVLDGLRFSDKIFSLVKILDSEMNM